MVFGHVNADDFLAFCGDDALRAGGQFQRFVAIQGCLFGVDGFNGRDVRGRKKLLRFFAGLSAFAVVHPIDFAHVLNSLFRVLDGFFIDARRNRLQVPNQADA